MTDVSYGVIGSLTVHRLISIKAIMFDTKQLRPSLAYTLSLKYPDIFEIYIVRETYTKFSLIFPHKFETLYQYTHAEGPLLMFRLLYHMHQESPDATTKGRIECKLPYNEVQH